MTSIAGHPGIGEAFELKFGQQVSFPNAGLTITFKAVNDSRCPRGAVCVWAGNAEVVVGLSHADIVLNTNIDPAAASHAGYTLRLVSLSPYPEVNHQIQTQDYVARLVMSKD
jgi:hypothetical protein